jgi:hypothetical protein
MMDDMFSLRKRVQNLNAPAKNEEQELRTKHDYWQLRW